MKIILHNQDFNSDKDFLESNNGYYLVSLKWTAINDAYVTFIRKNAVAYCYNLNWAGPRLVHELGKIVKKDETIIVSHSKINQFLTKTMMNDKECIMLPNTDEVRRIIGFDSAALKIVG